MGCAQSSRVKRKGKRRGKGQQRRNQDRQNVSAQYAVDEDHVSMPNVSAQYPVDETYHTQDGSVQLQNVSAQYPPGETYPAYEDVGAEQRVVNKQQTMLEHPPIRHPSQFQHGPEYVDRENEGSVQHGPSPHQKMFEGPPDPPTHTPEIPVVPENYVAPATRGGNIPANYTAPAHRGANLVPPPAPPHGTHSGNYTAPPAPLHSTHPGNYGAPPDPRRSTNPENYDARASSFPNDGTSPPQREADVAENYGDEMGGRPPQYVPPHQEGDAAVKRKLEALSNQVDVERLRSSHKVETQNYQVPRNNESEYEKPEESKVMDAAQRIPYQPRQQEQPNEPDPYAPTGKPEVWVSRPTESVKPTREDDIGSICIDARTGEYRYYQRGVHMGTVDKEQAERYSKDWPICPGTAARPLNHGRLQKSVPLNGRNGGNREMYVSPARPYQNPGSWVNPVHRGQPMYQQMGREDDRYSKQAYRGPVVAQPTPGHRGYYT